MLLLILGLSIGFVSSAIGVGGGILLVPALLALLPEESHTVIAAMSLATMVLSAGSGSFVYGRKSLVNYKVAALCALMAFPGTFVGVSLSKQVSSELFMMIFGIALLVYGPLLYKKQDMRKELADVQIGKQFYVFAGAASFFIGIVSAFLAIGGGILYVPLLMALGLPVRHSVGSSQFIITITSFIAASQHFYHGHLDLGSSAVWFLAAGMFMGGQLGPRLSVRLPVQLLVRFLSGLLVVLGIYLLMKTFL